MEDILYTVKETSKLLKVNTNFVYKLIKEGKLKALRLGSIKIRKRDLDNFILELETLN